MNDPALERMLRRARDGDAEAEAELIAALRRRNRLGELEVLLGAGLTTLEAALEQGPYSFREALDLMRLLTDAAETLRDDDAQPSFAPVEIVLRRVAGAWRLVEMAKGATPTPWRALRDRDAFDPTSIRADASSIALIGYVAIYQRLPRPLQSLDPRGRPLEPDPIRNSEFDRVLDEAIAAGSGRPTPRQLLDRLEQTLVVHEVMPDVNIPMMMPAYGNPPGSSGGVLGWLKRLFS